MSESTFDFCIIGAGAAGLNLALAMSKDEYFADKQILLIDKSTKSKNDKTWCFWEKGSGKWDSIIDKKWERARINSNKDELVLNLKPYSYKKLNAISFYNHVREELSKKSNFTWILDEIAQTEEKGGVVRIDGNIGHYHSKICFDSRIDSGYSEGNDKYIRILQHFKGWVISFEDEVFKPDEFTMMDFRLKHENSTSFTYILPINKKEALVEFTLFTPDLLHKDEYDKYLKEYISTYISNEAYQINDEEYGVIPMTNYPFHESSTNRIIKIGTAGSWVRASTGYSFKYSEKNALRMIENIKLGKSANMGLLNKKFRFYDTLLLDILHEHNELGSSIFSRMYASSPVSLIFKFLDGETTLFQDLKIISRLNPFPFLRALWRRFVN